MKKWILSLSIVVVFTIPSYAINPTSFTIESIDGDPYITLDDIVIYDWHSHTITLQPGEREILKKKISRTLQQSFVLRINNKVIYRGNFVNPMSSVSIGSIVIIIPSLNKDLSEDQIRITLGYPNEKYFKETDERSDARIHKALDAAEKIREGA